MVGALLAVSLLMSFGQWRSDGLLNRMPASPDVLSKVDVVALVRRSGCNPRIDHPSHSQEIDVEVIDGSTTLRKMAVLWPMGPEAFVPEKGKRFLLLGKGPVDGVSVSLGNLDLIPDPALPRGSNVVSGLALLETQATGLTDAASTVDTILKNSALCLASKSAEAAWRARMFLELHAHPGRTGFGHEPDAFEPWLFRLAPSLPTASQCLAYELLASWKTDGAVEPYLRSLLEAGAAPGGLVELKQLGFRPVRDTRYETAMRVKKGLPALGPLWTGKEWVRLIRDCKDQVGVSIALDSGRVCLARREELQALQGRLESKGSLGAQQYAAMCLGRRDLVPTAQNEADWERNWRTLLSLLREV